MIDLTKTFIQKELQKIKELFKNLKDLKKRRNKKEITTGGFYKGINAFIEQKSFYTSKTLSFQ